jgi:hypothetical protein
MRTRTTLVTLAALAAMFSTGLLFPEPVHAGCIVLKNGEVLVGRIREDEITKTNVTIRWPYKEKTERGVLDCPRFRVRWFDPKADEPTDEYWEKYGEEFIDAEWRPLYEKWKLRKKAREESLEGDFLMTAENFISKAQLSAIPVENGNFKIQKPEGWTSSIDENGITIFTSDKPGTEGFRARIHVFAVKSAIGQTEDQVRWVEKEVERLAGPGGKFEVRERKRLKARASGFDQEMVTQTTRFERTVMTLRKMMFRKKNTYFFTAYAHERDYSGLELLFKACMRSLELREDSKKSSRRKPPAPGGAPGGSPSSGG